MSIKITSLEITIGDITYRADEVYQVSPPPDTRRLILSLVRYVEQDGDLSEASGELMVARSQALKSAFAKKFPNAAKLKETSSIYPQFSEWKYILREAETEHIEWARAAKECGLIDTYIADYDPGRANPA